jgi:enoyl-CoA hydratase/carnithine racemase
MSEHVLSSLQDRVLTLRLNRLDKKNALTQDMYAALASALRAAAADPAVRVAVIAGGPDIFCSGNDVMDFLKAEVSSTDIPTLHFMRALAEFPKPAIAAALGPAIGIGATMLMQCDLAYLGTSARLQFPFVSLGISPEFASSYLLPRIVGHARAAEIVLFGEPVSAAQALAWGIANAVLPDAELEAHVMERARKLAAQPPEAVRNAKKLMRKWPSEVVDRAIMEEMLLVIAGVRGPEANEAMSAFMQKRKPDFSKF